MRPSDRPTELGINRTGISLSPIDGPALVEAANQAKPSSPGSDRDLAEVRKRFMEEVHAFGHMPPPTTIKGIVSAGKQFIQGKRNAVFLDKLGERLAFERTGVRLFDGLITKLEAFGSWEGGPTRADLDTFRDDEARHFALIHETIVNLGADPTAVTPSADLAGVESAGILQAIVDPRTTLAQALHAHLAAELVDAAAWDQLVVLADLLGHENLARSFRDAHVVEIKHRDTVAGWLEKHTALAARGELKYSA